MNSRMLIDSVVQQTTILIAQLSTAAGIRAPLAHVVDQVFRELSRSLEQQGVGRKIIADMFGMTLRAYQKKVQRLAESASVRDRSLWEALYAFLQANESCSRRAILDEFSRDDDTAIGAVLNDLVSSGLVRSAGRGASSTFRLTSEVERSQLAGEERRLSATALVWMSVYREPATIDVLFTKLPFEAELVRGAVDDLVADGSIVRLPSGTLRASQFVIPLGAKQGWEAAVFDHFRAVATAIGKKVSSPGSRVNDVVGGFTLSLDLAPGHPHFEEATRLLVRTRSEVTALFERVSEFNRAHPIPSHRKQKLYFYCGQYLEEVEEPVALSRSPETTQDAPEEEP